MDAVEFTLPAVAGSQLLTSEGYHRVGVTVEEAEDREPECVSIPISPLIASCSSSLSHKVTASGQNSASWNKLADAELCRHVSHLPRFQGENISEQLSFRGANSSLFLLPKCVGKQLHRKAGKVSRSSSPCPKRPRMEQVEESMSQAGADERHAISENLGSYLTKCSFAEKSRVVKRKNSLDGKRHQKRNFEALTKTKFDTSFLENGLVSPNSPAGDNILGRYGFKSDIHDVTKHADELSLNELLDGSYKCPSLCQDKGKKAANTNENILHSVRRAFSILQLCRPVRYQNAVELNSSSNGKMPTCHLSSGCLVTNSIDSGKGDDYMSDLASCSKIQDSCSKPGAPVNMIDSPLYQPKDILERIALPPPDYLDALLVDAAKPAVSSRNTPDQRSRKPLCHKTSLPPFPWSHSFGGPWRTNFDAGKLSTNRSTCQDRWVRMGSAASSLRSAPNCFSDLDSLTYDHSLVPSVGLKSSLSENEKALSTFVRLPWCEQALPSTPTCLVPSNVTPGHSSRLLAAAQTLWEIASHSTKQNKNSVMTRWPKKASQMAMKARKSRSSTGKSEISVALKSVNIRDQTIPAKKLKASMTDKKKGRGCTNIVGRGPLKWSTPTSSRSPPCKLEKDMVAETKQSNDDIIKLLGMMPPSTSVLDKACNSQQKQRKAVVIDWCRGRSKKE